MKIEIVFSEKQTLFDRAVEENDNTLYGGAKGGGKSAGLRRVMIKRRLQYPRTTGVIFRRTYPELYENHISKLHGEFPELMQYYSEKHKQLTLPNGSVLKFRYCQHRSDLETQRGQEYDDLGIEEAGQWPEEWFFTIKQANRTSVDGYSPKTILTGNPGGVGHKWMKRMFITKQHTPEEAEETWAYVEALVDDNPWLMRDGGKYKRTLQMEKNPMLRSAYLEANWDIAAGQFFQEFRRDIHVLPASFKIEDHWYRFGGYDHGFNHPASFHWCATNEDGDVFVYREFVRAGMRVDELSDAFCSFKDTARLQDIRAGHDIWADRGAGSKKNHVATIANDFFDFSKGQLVFKKATIGRVQGANQVRQYLAPVERQLVNPENRREVITIQRPRLFILESCPVLIDTLTRLTHDPDNVEDVLKVDAVDGDPFSGDDAYDSFRYALMSRPPLSLPKKKGWRERYKSGGDRTHEVPWHLV